MSIWQQLNPKWPGAAVSMGTRPTPCSTPSCLAGCSLSLAHTSIGGAREFPNIDADVGGSILSRGGVTAVASPAGDTCVH